MVYTFFGRLNFRFCTARFCECSIDVNKVMCTCNGVHDCLSNRALSLMNPAEPEKSEPEQYVVICAMAAMFILIVLIAALLCKLCQKRNP